MNLQKDPRFRIEWPLESKGIIGVRGCYGDAFRREDVSMCTCNVLVRRLKVPSILMCLRYLEF